MNIHNLQEELDKFTLNENNFELKTVLGQGAFGFVYEGIELSTNNIVAIKQINLDTFGAHSWNCLTKQISVLFKCDHPSIIKLQGFYYNEQQNRLSLVMPKFKSDLFTWLRECHRRLQDLPVTEKLNIEEALIEVIHQISSAGNYLIEKLGIVHRDIKPENILIGDDNNEFILIDFDICEKVQPGKHIIIGASAFFPPEIIHSWESDEKFVEFDLEKADVFALGCTVLEIISCDFYIKRIDKCRQNETTIKDIIEKSTVVGAEIKKLLYKMLEINPEKRLKFGEVLFQIEQIIDKRKQSSQQEIVLESENETLKNMIMKLLEQKKNLLVQNCELDEQCKDMEVNDNEEFIDEVDEEEDVFDNFHSNLK